MKLLSQNNIWDLKGMDMIMVTINKWGTSYIHTATKMDSAIYLWQLDDHSYKTGDKMAIMIHIFEEQHFESCYILRRVTLWDALHFKTRYILRRVTFWDPLHFETLLHFETRNILRRVVTFWDALHFETYFRLFSSAKWIVFVYL